MGNVYLIGMMGSGKSAIGKKLAGILAWTFVDLDEEIQKKNGKTIVKIFKEEGEPFFRDEETSLLDDVSGKEHCVVATGGGVVLRSHNVARMRETGEVVFLWSPLEVLWQRVKQKKHRPLLKNEDPKGSLTRIFREREHLYKNACKFEVNAAEGNAGTVARQISEKLEKER